MRKLFPLEYSFPVSLEGGGWVIETRRLAYAGAPPTKTIGEPRRTPMRPIQTAPLDLQEKINQIEPPAYRGWMTIEDGIVLICEEGRITYYLKLDRSEDRGTA